MLYCVFERASALSALKIKLFAYINVAARRFPESRSQSLITTHVAGRRKRKKAVYEVSASLPLLNQALNMIF